jgi:hypothetical protein
MSNQIQPQSQTQADVPINGEIKVETATGQPYNHGYKLEDFSQQKINSGQQRINGLIVDADRRVGDAFDKVYDLFVKLASSGKVDSKTLGELAVAIDKIKQATAAIAGPFPPGCTYGGQSEPPPG